MDSVQPCRRRAGALDMPRSRRESGRKVPFPVDRNIPSLNLVRNRLAKGPIDGFLRDEALFHGFPKGKENFAAVKVTAVIYCQGADSAGVDVTLWWRWKSAIAPQSETTWPEKPHSSLRIF